MKVTIAHLYAPNSQQDTFIKRHLELLQNFSEGQLIIDLNIPLLPIEDTSTRLSSTPRGTCKVIHSALHTAQLIDAWRLFHPGKRDYTLYSCPHNTYSRIDYFLIPYNQLQAVKDTAIGSITWLDHAPVTLQYALTDFHRGKRKPWRLNESLLQDPEVLADVIKEITHYFHINDSTDSDMGLEWEAHKAVIRGGLIKYGVRIKRQRTAQLTSLLSRLQTLEAKH